MKLKLTFLLGIAATLSLTTAALYAQDGGKKSDPKAADVAPADAAAPSHAPTVVDALKREEFEANVGKQVTVRGAVLRTKDWDGGSQKKKKMNFVDLKGGFFSTVTFEDDYPAFGNNLPAAAYKGKTIEVTGALEERQGHWQIILKSPDQVKVVDGGEKKDDKKADKSKKDKSDDKKDAKADKATDEAEAAKDAETPSRKRVDSKEFFR